MIKTIIMAAGEGTRMKSNKSKVLHKILNKEIIKYIVDASNFENSKTIIIGGKNHEILKDMFNDKVIIEQKIGPDCPYGTGYATSLAIDYIDDSDQVLVLNGDIPLIKKETLEKFISKHNEMKSACSILSTIVTNPFGYGRIVRDADNNFLKIVEQKDLEESELSINEINAGIYLSLIHI